MTDDIGCVFGAAGPLAREIENYRPRTQQIEMARTVAGALAGRENLLVEAGTGVGKTFAYLVPALESGCQVVISTGTRTLQDQLFNRDLPVVSAAIGRPAGVALLKGRANYLCLHRLDIAPFDKKLGSKARAHLHAVSDWARVTAGGEISEVASVPERSSVWPRVTSTAENCLGQECDFYQDCFVVKARRDAQAADIVVVNHHLLMADLALREGGFGELLPAADAVIIDEAHQLPETAAQFFSTSLGSRRIHSLASDLMLESAGTPLRAEVWKRAEAMQQTLKELRLALGSQTGRRRLDEVGGRIDSPLTRMGAALSEAEDALGGLVAGESRGLESCKRRLGECLAQIDLLGAADNEEGLRWVDVRRTGFTLNMTPFDVAGKLSAVMQSRACAWVFTSATLAVGDDFSHFATRIGADDAATLRLDSPFDFARQSCLYVPDGMPDPGAPDHTARVVEEALPLIRASGGRAFLLFTSHRALREAADLLAEALPFPMLVQGNAPREELLVRFRALGNAVLLGTSSFWEGVDVRGPALSLVVIDKLPFASPGDPVLQARLEAIKREGGNPFSEYQLPQAVLALKQGVGRLIRDHADTGVAMICDPRLLRRGYGRLFLRSLPPMARVNSRRAVCDFLKQHGAARPVGETA